MEFHQLLGQRQTQTGSTLEHLASADLGKSLEELGEILWSKPPAVIADGEDYKPTLFLKRAFDQPILLGKFDGVRKQIEDHLPQPVRIRKNTRNRFSANLEYPAAGRHLGLLNSFLEKSPRRNRCPAKH